MKNNRIIFITSLIIFFLCMGQLNSAAQTLTEIPIQGMEIEGQNNVGTRHSITNSPIELIGPEQEVTFYYENISDAKGQNNQLVLDFTHSEMLISPSSLTLSVDGQTITSKPLNSQNEKGQIIFPLTGNALKKGSHSVKVSYHGVIKEGVCVDQGTSGNWLNIGINSYIQLNGQINDIKQSLKDYPDIFQGTSTNPVFIILPDKASMETLNSGLMVATYLREQSYTEGSVQMVRESNVKSLRGNVLFIGAQTEFSTPFMKQVMEKASLPTDNQSLLLSRHKLVNGKNKVEALFVTAKTPGEIQKRVSVLTNQQWMKQLSGNQMSIQTIPNWKETDNHRQVTLKQFGMGNFILDSTQGKSQHYFYYLPKSLHSGQTSTLKLHLKRSETILPTNEKMGKTINGGEVELVVFINDVPHSVDLRTLKNAENGVYTVNIPIDAKTIKDNGMMDIQFVANGLNQKNSCTNSDENRWIYISDDSSFNFPSKDQKDEGDTTFAAYPLPFGGKDSKTTIILPQTVKVEDQQLLALYLSLSMNGQLPQITLTSADKVEMNELKNTNAIFIGGPALQPLLNKVNDQLEITYKEKSKPDLNKYGFIPESVDLFSWIQPNPWSPKQNSILVLDHQISSTPLISKTFLDYLVNNDEESTIIVQSNNNQLFSNASQIKIKDQKEAEEKGKKQGRDFSILWIIEFVALILLIALLIIIVRKRGKRKE
ncbi:cellulose biosynthesis cyclic di-GMP-binding regulatory protein BcsB [Bacillus sp. Gen3]|nr:cellulose biosynthesis cyclic di-GMP-binding regulatory protein BcsB [Bacillus sp. Gen3]